MLIDVTTLKKNYKNQEVLKGIDIQVETPQILALVGPNGAGKTTLMNCMMNLLPFNEGHVTLLGRNIPTRPFSMMCRICRTTESYMET